MRGRLPLGTPFLAVHLLIAALTSLGAAPLLGPQETSLPRLAAAGRLRRVVWERYLGCADRSFLIERE
jgi:hypothetical protein